MLARTGIALASLAGFAAPFLAALLTRLMPPAEAALWQTLALQLCWVGLAGLVALRLGGSVAERLGLARGRSTAPSVALGIAGTLALSTALQLAVDALALAPGSSLERLNDVAQATAARQPWLLALALGVAPGLAEELLFRGALQRGFAHRLGAWCVPAAAAAFAALHLDLVHSPAAFVLGCYLGALAWRAQSTWPAIAAHVANNCAAALPQVVPGAAPWLPRAQSWGEAALCVAVAALALALAQRASEAGKSPRNPASG